MTNLSPAAQAVLDAYMNNCGWLDGPLEKDYRCAAAHLLKEKPWQLGVRWSAEELQSIARELEAQP